MEIEVENASERDVNEALLIERASFCMQELRLHEDTVLAIRLVNEDEMSALHLEWMELAGPTDVLSFPMDELTIPAPGEAATPGILGDIAICPQVAALQADESGHSCDEELGMLLTHGILHLLGMDHADEAEHREMFALQDHLRAQFRQRQL